MSFQKIKWSLRFPLPTPDPSDPSRRFSSTLSFQKWLKMRESRKIKLMGESIKTLGYEVREWLGGVLEELENKQEPHS